MKTYLPEFAGEGRDAVTVRHLLTHTGGLSSGLSLTAFAEGVERARANLVTAKLSHPAGTKFVYSDTSFLLLGELVARVAGQPLDVHTRSTIYAPLGLRETGYRPDAALRARCAPTERRGDAWMRGEVHDPRAWALGGVAGHAGLFSTADDLAVLATALLRGGEFGGQRILDENTVRLMFSSQPLPEGGSRGLAWDKETDTPSIEGTFSRKRPADTVGLRGPRSGSTRHSICMCCSCRTASTRTAKAWSTR